MIVENIPWPHRRARARRRLPYKSFVFPLEELSRPAVERCIAAAGRWRISLWPRLAAVSGSWVLDWPGDQQSTMIGVNCRWFSVPTIRLSKSMSMLFLGWRERVQHSSGHQAVGLMFHGIFAEFWRDMAHNGNA
jgi:hypothetical protein